MSFFRSQAWIRLLIEFNALVLLHLQRGCQFRLWILGLLQLYMILIDLPFTRWILWNYLLFFPFPFCAPFMFGNWHLIKYMFSFIYALSHGLLVTLVWWWESNESFPICFSEIKSISWVTFGPWRDHLFTKMR